MTASPAPDSLVQDQDLDDLPLPILFSRCQQIHNNLDHIVASVRPAPAPADPSSSTSASYLNQGSRSQQQNSVVARAERLLMHCERMVEAQGIFSSNEDQDDIATGDLKYLLVPFYRGELLSSAPTPGPSQRREAAVAALRCYDRLLNSCGQYNLMGELAGQVQRQLEAGGGVMDPGTKRLLKIEKFKREKAINARLGELDGQQRRRAELEQDAEEDGPVGGARGSDEEDQRTAWFLRLELACLRALDQAAFLNQELQLLQHGATAGNGSSNGSSNGAGQGPPGGSEEQREMMDKLREVMASLDVGTKRQQQQKMVFRPSHILPTMTLEQQAQIEVADAQRREQSEARQQAEQRRKQAEMDSDEEDALEKMRLRAQDDHNDANPRGWGNSKLRPCG